MAARKELSDVAGRIALIRAAQGLSRSGLSPQVSGNLSIRMGDGFLITPSGVAFTGLKPADLAWVSLDGVTSPGPRPSSEWPMHRAIYAKRADALAIVHTHSIHATALACAQREIPAFHYMVGVTGVDKVPVARYATFGTEALARNVADALGSGYASLIANHGLIVCGRTLAHACRLAAEVETLAQQYILTLQAGVPRLLDRAEMARVIAKFADYGPDMDAMPEAAE